MNTAARSGLTVAAVAGLGGIFLTGVAVGQLGSEGGPLPQPTQPPLTLANADLRAPEDCQDLLGSLIDRSIDRVTAWGWNGPMVYAYDGALPELDSSGGVGSAPQAAQAPQPADGRATEQTNSETGTNVQETGVDEPDTVKTNGRLLLRTDGSVVRVYDVTGDSPELVGDLALRDLDDPELLLSGDQGVVLGTDQQEEKAVTRVVTFDLTDPSDPVVTSTRTFTASTVRAVQHGATVRLILSTGLPDLDGFVEPRPWRGQEAALAANKAVVRDSTIEDWLPTVTTYDGTGDRVSTDPLVDCGRVAIPTDEHAEPGTMPIVAFDATDPDTLVTSAVATSTSLAYVSPDRLYLATSGWGGWGTGFGTVPQPCCEPDVAIGSPQDLGTSTIYDFVLSGLDATYVASGEVEGTIRDRWAMDSHGGALRVAVGPSSQTGTFNSVLTLTEQGSDLMLAGRVDKLGIGEQIKSVRWFDDLAVVVTFQQTDPLYVIDLRDDEHPRLAGELKIPGYSEYLHPIGGDRVLGLGQDATGSGSVLGAQAALFDISDMTDPRRTDVVRFPSSSRALAGQDPRQFTWLPDRSTALTVVSSEWQGSMTGWVSVLRVEGDRIVDHKVPVEYGEDTAQVRLVPLPSGKVVLVTGEAVSFFDV